MYTQSSEQEIIDRFISRNKSVLKQMDEKNRRDIMTYSSEVSSLNDKNPYERKIAVRNILGTFLTDWD